MRYRRLLAVPVVALMLAAACGGDDDDDSGANQASGDQQENTGTVNLMSAGEPEEVDAYQQIFDDLINSDTDYDVEIESVGDFEEQFQIRAEGGTLDVAAVPQPGAIPDLVDSGSLVALEDMGFDIDELNDTLGESFVSLGE
jgi:ABC-type glycerol-3-phosphate transport system substrate-binding protein